MERFFAIIIIIFLSFPVFADQKKEALKHAGLAYIKYTKIDKVLRRLEKKYISNDIKIVSTFVFKIGNIYQTKYISYTWSFP